MSAIMEVGALKVVGEICLVKQRESLVNKYARGEENMNELLIHNFNGGEKIWNPYLPKNGLKDLFV